MCTDMSTRAPSSPPAFLSSVLWSWLSLAASVISGLILTPYMLKSLGATAYGVWILGFAVAESYWLFDFGIRSATTHFSARSGAAADPSQLSQVISTSMVYFGAVGLFVLGTTTAALHW